ncbi:hypothetical protein DW095_09230 [Bacteroides sp. AM07-16]|nr:hypothetical protein DW095_09230 [Bacteroides sp. AM07-16]
METNGNGSVLRVTNIILFDKGRSFLFQPGEIYITFLLNYLYRTHFSFYSELYLRKRCFEVT